MSIGTRIRALLHAHPETLARHDLSALAARIIESAPAFDLGYTPAAPAPEWALLDEFEDRIEQVCAQLSGIDPEDPHTLYVPPVDIVDAHSRRIGSIDVMDPDYDTLMWLSINLNRATARAEPIHQPPPSPRVRMHGLHRAPQWAHTFPYWRPGDDHTELVHPTGLDAGRARLLTAMTGASCPNAALLSLWTVNVGYAHTIPDGVAFTVPGTVRDTRIRVRGDGEHAAVQVWLSRPDTEEFGVLACHDQLDLTDLRTVVQDSIGAVFACGAAELAHAAGQDATPPHPAVLAAAELRRDYTANPDLSATVMAAPRPGLGSAGADVLTLPEPPDMAGPGTALA